MIILDSSVEMLFDTIPAITYWIGISKGARRPFCRSMAKGAYQMMTLNLRKNLIWTYKIHMCKRLKRWIKVNEIESEQDTDIILKFFTSLVFLLYFEGLPEFGKDYQIYEGGCPSDNHIEILKEQHWLYINLLLYTFILSFSWEYSIIQKDNLIFNTICYWY